MESRAVSGWILDRLEDPGLWSDGNGPAGLSSAQLAAGVRHDEVLVEAAGTLTGQRDPNLAGLVGRLVADQSVPFLAALRRHGLGLSASGRSGRGWGVAASGGRAGSR